MHPVLKTDHYKLTMAEAGWPLRNETFYYSHRRGGPHLLPFDAAEELAKLNPFKGAYNASDLKEARNWLDGSNGTVFGGWLSGLSDADFQYKVLAPPKGSWICDRDPMFVVSGSSFAVSWLEPLVLQMNYKIQVATLAATDPEALAMEVDRVTCEEHRDIVLELINNASGYKGQRIPKIKINVRPEEYYNHVKDKVKALIDVVGDPSRIFEVGMRGAVCEEQHLIALSAAKDAGLLATSNVYGAHQLGLKSVGTMGHEHVQRYGSDEAAYRAMVERIPGPVFFLLDTFDTEESGIPTAFKIIKEHPHRNHAVRFDSGDIRSQFIHAVFTAKRMGIKPRFCLEDGWNLRKTIEFEKLRKELELPPEQVLYGYGGHIVNSPFTQLTRDRVSAVWKLTQTGNTPTMKFGSEPGRGKESLPGKPILYWSESGTLIVQGGEPVPRQFSNYECAFVGSSGRPIPHPNTLERIYKEYYSGLRSPGTKTLVRQLTKKKNEMKSY